MTLRVEEDHLNAPLVFVTVRLHRLIWGGGGSAPELGHSSHHPLEVAQTQELLPARSALMSSGGLDLIGWLGIEVLPDGVVVYGCSHGYEQVPNGMSKWDNAITFEKDHP